MQYITESSPVETGATIDGKYVLGTCLDGITYETTYSDQPAVLKVFRSDNPRFTQDLLALLKVSAGLHHIHLVAIHDVGCVAGDDGDLVYVVMERGDESLASVLKRRALDEIETRELLLGIVPALRHIHAAGYVHGRIHPGNVFACGDQVKLSAEQLLLPGHAPVPHAPAGLRDAPETAGGAFQAQSDVWSLAVLTREALTGSPLEGDAARVREPFRELITRGLERDPKKRIHLDAVERLLTYESKPTAEPEPPSSTTSLNRKKAFIAGALLVGAVSLSVFVIRGVYQAPPRIAPVVIDMKAPARPPKPAPPIDSASQSPVEPAVSKSGWAVVAGTYNRQPDAEKRAGRLNKSHPALNAQVTHFEDRYLVVVGSGLSQEGAEQLLTKARHSGAPGDSYIAQLDQ